MRDAGEVQLEAEAMFPGVTAPSWVSALEKVAPLWGEQR